MTGTRSELLLWAQRVISRRGSPAHELLELRPDATVDDAQAKFHELARVAHPDLHRTGLSPDELELVTSAYASVAGAYHTFRSQATSTQRMKPLRPDQIAGAVAPAVPITSASPESPRNAAATLSSKSLVYYRKAELALRRGDLKGALLQLKLAIAADPHNAFLRTALAEVDAELRKTP